MEPTQLKDLYRPHVERGAALLDERRPRWWERIDIGRLDIRSPENCILGQVFEEEERAEGPRRGSTPYDYGCEVLNLKCMEAIEHGFFTILRHHRDKEHWDTLRGLWIEAIEERHKEGSGQ